MQTASDRGEFQTSASLQREDLAADRERLLNRVIGNAAQGQGLAGNYYGSGAFDLAPGEALVLSFDEPRALLCRRDAENEV